MSPVPVPANVRTSSRPRANDAAAPTPASPLLNHQNDVDANAQLVSDLDRAAIAEHAAFHKKATQCAFAIPSNTLFGHARRDAVMRSVLTRELVVLLALRDAVPATERDELCESLVLLLEPSNAALYAIEAIVAVEVAGTLSEGTLFRTNSIASKMMQCYSKRLPDGAAYLRAVLDPLIRDVCSGRYGSLEVNPDHASAGDDPARNMQTLIHLAQAFLNAVLDGVHQMPIGLQHLCAHLRACVQQRFASDAGSNAVLSVIGGFLFLRFFCPAIVSPETHGFVDEPPHRDVRRILVLVSKALQNLANRTAFREKYMGAMNAFLEQNQQKVVDYLRDAAVLIHSSGSVPVRQAVPDDERDAAFTRVHRLAAPRLPDIEARARVLFPSMLEAALEQTRTFATAMAELGAPPPLAAAGANDSSSNLTSLARTQQAAAAAAATAQKSGGKGGFFGKLSKRSAAKRSVRDAQALFHALDIGDDAGAIQLLSKNEELLMARNDNGMTPIILAANHGNAALVKYLLELKADCFVADMNGWTVLHAACFAKRDDIVDDLLNESHIDVSAKNEDGNTPLHYFARSKHDPLVAKKLLRTFAARGADLNARNNIGDTPLHAAAWKGNIQMAQALLRAGASALLRNDDGQSARTIARVTENHELDAVLDEAGAPRHTLDRKTELATAGGRPAPGPLSPRGGGGGGGGGGADGPESPRGRGSSGGGAAAAAAAAATATTTATTASGSTSPVLEGRSSGRGRPASPTLVATLRDSSILQSSASTGKEQFLADVVACRVTAVRNALGGSHRETLLRARGAHGATPMHLLAASGGDPRAVSLAEHLVKLGGDVNAVDDGGFTPIILAVYRNNQPVLRVLMASSIVNVAAANNAGCTAFHYLPRLSPFDRQTVRTLLAMANAPIDAPNKSGDTPLMLAAASGALDACELLLAAGAVPLRRNSTRQTAIDLAQAAGRTDVVSILQEAQRKQPSMFNVVQQSGEYGIVRPNSQADEGYDALPGERSAVDASGENPYGITPLPPPVDENYHAAPLPLEAAIDDDDVDAVRGGAASEYGALPSFRDVPVPIPREELPEVFLDDLTDLPDLPPAPPTTGDDDE
jgi:ankyrin repeat protein